MTSPFSASRVRPDAFMGFSPVNSEAHVPGRHLNALLNAESAAGIQVDEAAVENHARAAFLSYGGPVPLPLNREEVGGPLANFTAHNVREGFHALYSLVKFRESQKARRLAEASIETIFDHWDGGWDAARLESKHGISMLPERAFISGLARAIGPLVKYYRATRYGPALELATVLKEKALSEAFNEDGSFDERRFGTHCHSHHMCHVVPGPARRSYPRLHSDGPREGVLRQRPLGDPRRDRVEHRDQLERGELGPRRGQQHRGYPRDRSHLRPVGLH